MSMINEKDDFGSVLNTLRRSRKLSLRAFAKELGRSPQTINNWIQGKHFPREVEVVRIIETLQPDESAIETLYALLGYVYNRQNTKKKFVLNKTNKIELANYLKEWVGIHRSAYRLMPHMLILGKEFDNISVINQAFIDRVYDQWFEIYRWQIKQTLKIFNESLTLEQDIYDSFTSAINDSSKGLITLFNKLSRLDIIENRMNPIIECCNTIAKLIDELLNTLNEILLSSLKKIESIASLLVEV